MFSPDLGKSARREPSGTSGVLPQLRTRNTFFTVRLKYWNRSSKGLRDLQPWDLQHRKDKALSCPGSSRTFSRGWAGWPCHPESLLMENRVLCEVPIKTQVGEWCTPMPKAHEFSRKTAFSFSEFHLRSYLTWQCNYFSELLNRFHHWALCGVRPALGTKWLLGLCCFFFFPWDLLLGSASLLSLILGSFPYTQMSDHCTTFPWK